MKLIMYLVALSSVQEYGIKIWSAGHKKLYEIDIRSIGHVEKEIKLVSCIKGIYVEGGFTINI